MGLYCAIVSLKGKNSLSERKINLSFSGSIFCLYLQKISNTFYTTKQMANKAVNAKKKMVISYANLSQELIEAFKTRYPTGYSDALIRVDKPNGEFFHVVPLETPEISYLVKVAVKIDTKPEEELEKDYYSDQDDEIEGADQIADTENDDE